MPRASTAEDPLYGTTSKQSSGAGCSSRASNLMSCTDRMRRRSASSAYGEVRFRRGGQARAGARRLAQGRAASARRAASRACRVRLRRSSASCTPPRTPALTTGGQHARASPASEGACAPPTVLNRYKGLNICSFAQNVKAQHLQQLAMRLLGSLPSPVHVLDGLRRLPKRT